MRHKPCCAERQSCAARSATGGALSFGLRSAHLTSACLPHAPRSHGAGITFQSGELDGFDINFVELVRCSSCDSSLRRPAGARQAHARRRVGAT